mmetsp:Transcript_19658/g.29131  ORF Transcript_19658/g.29131 Transcript_19658/m.29131 type:complete len:887 (+) Transcript_19658:124-2784(+)
MTSSIIEPFLEPLDTNGDYILPTTQYIANAAILVIFAYLVALVIMEINYFRFAVWMAWRRMERLKTNEQQGSGDGQNKVDGCLENNEMKEEDEGEKIVVEKNCTRSVSSSEMSASSEENQKMMTPSRNSDVENDHPETQSNNDAIQIDQGVTVVTTQQEQSPRQQNRHHSSIPDIESSSHSAIGHLMDDVRSNLSSLQPTSPLRSIRSSSIISIDNNSSHKSLTDENDNPTNSNHNSASALQKAYQTIHTSSLIAILASLTLYTITATCMALFTRGLKDEVVAVIVGFSKFVASVIVFILSAKVPQWIGVYHQGAIRLAKCSSNLSIHFMNIDLTTTQSITKLRHHVLLGVSFHFAKFYILLLPFYCGVRPITIPFSIITGSITGFVLMWCIFLVHERNRNRRNIVAFFVIFICSVMSSLLFVRGMAWIQVIWGLTLMEDENAILVTSFFGWLVFMMGVHALFVWHTLRMERRYKMMEGEGGDVGAEDANGNDTNDENKHSSTVGGGEENRRKASCDDVEDNDERCPVDTNVTSERSKMKKTSSYDSFLFDPRFQDGSFRGYKEHSNDTKKVGMSPSRSTGAFMIDDNNNGRVIIETTPVVASSSAVPVSDEVSIDNQSGSGKRCKQRRRPDWCAIFMCNTPEYTKMSCFWKMIGWTKIVVIAISYLLCLYFVAVALGATRQIANTKENLPAVRKALYETQNEGPVCAFDNRGAASNITTFENKDAAHDAGFLIVHCGACGACSNWENLTIEYTTRNNMAALANKCAMRGLFGGKDETRKCITEPAIGFTGQCAVCWTEDIVCTKKHCSYIFLQSQITNSVGNFAVGPDDITSATCEEAHCEVGQFVPCVGATRRRMNIISSIPRPVEEQCQIVDVDWRELFAEYE